MANRREDSEDVAHGALYPNSNLASWSAECTTAVAAAASAGEP